MSDMKRVNPEVLKAAMQIAHRERECTMVSNGYAWSGNRVFDALNSNLDAYALEDALKRLGWSFGFVPDISGEPSFYWAEHFSNRPGDIYDDDSNNMLLLKVVASMRSLPLYAEESMG